MLGPCASNIIVFVIYGEIDVVRIISLVLDVMGKSQTRDARPKANYAEFAGSEGKFCGFDGDPVVWTSLMAFVLVSVDSVYTVSFVVVLDSHSYAGDCQCRSIVPISDCSKSFVQISFYGQECATGRFMSGLTTMSPRRIDGFSVKGALPYLLVFRDTSIDHVNE